MSNGRNRAGRYRDDGEHLDHTYLYISTNPDDNGSEPLNSALCHWLSPDIIVVEPDGTRGTQATANVPHTVEVRVNNTGGMPANDAYVEAFWNHPSIGDPGTMALIGGSYVTVPPFSSATVSIPWMLHSHVDVDHDLMIYRALWARVSLLMPPDSYADGSIFDVRNDRHVAQRNVHILLQEDDALSFSFLVSNSDTERPKDFQLQTRHMTEQDVSTQLIRSLKRTAAPGHPQGQPAKVSLDVRSKINVGRPRLYRKPTPTTGVLRRAIRPAGQHRAQVSLGPGEQRQATLTIERPEEVLPGAIAGIEIQQTDSKGEMVLDGMTLVIQYS